MQPIKIVIIGGVAGGATAAARARRLSENAQIIVLERGPYVSFANCGLPFFIGGEIVERDKLLLQTPESLRARHNLDVRIQSEVVRIDRARKCVVVHDLSSDKTYEESYDKLILSTGASPIKPPISGINLPNVFTLRTIPDTDAIKKAVDPGAKRAVVVGGGFIGLEMAENLRKRNLSVELVEMLDQVMPPLDREMASAVHHALRQGGVGLHLSDAVTAFEQNGKKIAVTLKSGARLPADLVILSIGVRPESKLAGDAGLELGIRGGVRVNKHMQTSDVDIYAVGDATNVVDFVTQAETLFPLAGPANRQGRIAADHALGRSSTYRGTQGTSIVRVFDLVVAQTGAGEKTLRQQAIPYRKVYIHPAHHVGYYPGSAAMHLKLLFSPDNGTVLGAQITGREGVDKRIDVLAVAIQARMTTYDLEEMELAYAPPFGAAKDPVNMAGFVACNTLRGDVVNVHADDLGTGCLLDVRTKAEFERGTIPGAKNIPVDELRNRREELPTDGRVVVFCQAGLRGYVAARMLAQLGLEAVNLSGGYLTYRAFHPESSRND